MNCPGEDVIAAFMQGTLAPIERSRMERHLDVCPACTALLASIGQVFGQDRPRSVGRQRPAAFETVGAPSSIDTVRGMLAVVVVAIAVLHTWAALLAAPFFARAVRALAAGEARGLESAAFAFGLFTYVVLPYAWWTVHAIVRDKRYAVRAARVYGFLSLFSIFATPFAAYSLWLTRGGAAR
jgi:hypothetical protein